MRNYNHHNKLGLNLVYKCIPVLRSHSEHDNVFEQNGFRFELETESIVHPIYNDDEKRFRVFEKDASGFQYQGVVIYCHNASDRFKSEDPSLFCLWESEYCALTLDGDILESVEIEEKYERLVFLSEYRRDDTAGVGHYYTINSSSPYKEEIYDRPINKE